MERCSECSINPCVDLCIDSQVKPSVLCVDRLNSNSTHGSSRLLSLTISSLPQCPYNSLIYYIDNDNYRQESLEHVYQAFY